MGHGIYDSAPGVQQRRFPLVPYLRVPSPTPRAHGPGTVGTGRGSVRPIGRCRSVPLTIGRMAHSSPRAEAG